MYFFALKDTKEQKMLVLCLLLRLSHLKRESIHHVFDVSAFTFYAVTGHHEVSTLLALGMNLVRHLF